MKIRPQLNLRFDGKEDLLKKIRTTAERHNLRVNLWVIRTLELAVKKYDRSNETISSIDRESAETKALEIIRQELKKLIPKTLAKTQEENISAETVYVLRREIRQAYNQLARQDGELLRLQEENRQLKLELEEMHFECTKIANCKSTKEAIIHSNPKNDYHKKIQATVSKL